VKTTNKALWIISMVMAAVTVLSGCTGNQPAQKAADGAATAPGAATPGAAPANNMAKKYKIEYMKKGVGASLPSAEKDALRPVIEKDLNIELAMNVLDEYDNKLNVRIAAGDFPDVFTLNKQKKDDFAKRGVLLDLYPFRDKLPNVQKYLGDIWNNGIENGKMYAIPGLPGQSPRYYSYWIRKDWLAKLGLQAPKTLDELANVAKAFALNDPDGNGKRDTYGISGNGLASFDPIFGAYGVHMTLEDSFKGEFSIKDGVLTNSLYAQHMPEALTYINQLIKAGAVDPEIMANKSANVRTAAFQGKAGIIFIDWASVMKDEYVTQWKTVNPNADWVQLEAIAGPGGKSNNVWDIGSGSGGTVLPKALEKDPDKLNRVLAFLDYMAAPKGSRLGQFGVEGVHYNMQGDKVVGTPKLTEEGAYFFLYQLYGRDDKVYLPSKFEKQSAYIENAFNQPHEPVYTSEISYPEGFNVADANRYIAEQLVQFVYGKTPIDQYDKFLKNLETTFKYKAYLDAAQKQFKESGKIK
jgi:putative aldouronate transport system substrate-binding protein